MNKTKNKNTDLSFKKGDVVRLSRKRIEAEKLMRHLTLNDSPTNKVSQFIENNTGKPLIIDLVLPQISNRTAEKIQYTIYKIEGSGYYWAADDFELYSDHFNDELFMVD